MTLLMIKREVSDVDTAARFELLMSYPQDRPVTVYCDQSVPYSVFCICPTKYVQKLVYSELLLDRIDRSSDYYKRY